MASTSVTIEAQETGANAPEKQPAADPNRPAWLPENFKTPEDFAKSYAEQRAELTRLQQGAKKPAENPAAKPEIPPADAKPSEGAKPDEQKPGSETPEDAAKKVTEAAGFDVTPFQAEYDASGDVSEESRAKIAAGLEKVLGKDARAVVDQFIEGQKVVHTNDRNLFMEAAGGEEQFQSMIAWAKENLPPEQIAAYNAQVDSRNRHTTLFAIEGLRAKFEAANGREPNLLKGRAPSSGSIQPFQSSAAMTEAMRDPRYKKDEGYRKEVQARLAISKF